MKIGFDLDKVFADYPPLVPYLVIDRLSKKSGDKLSYRFPGKFEQKIRIWSHHPKLRPAITPNIAALEELAQKKNLSLYLISGRYGFLKKRTDEWFAHNGIRKYFKRVYINVENEQPHIMKNKLIRSLQLDVYIDDDLELLSVLAEKNPTLKFYWLTRFSLLPRTFLQKNIIPIKNLEVFKNTYL